MVLIPVFVLVPQLSVVAVVVAVVALALLVLLPLVSIPDDHRLPAIPAGWRASVSWCCGYSQQQR